MSYKMKEQALREEALKKFPSGIKFTNHNLIPSQKAVQISDGKITRICIDEKENVVVIVAKNCRHYTVYKDGEWAIPVETVFSEPLLFN